MENLWEQPELTLVSFPPLCVLFHALIWIPVAEDYSVGFGGKFGVQRDRQDKNALGWDHQEEVQPHASQRGQAILPEVAAVSLEHTQTCVWSLCFTVRDPAAESRRCAVNPKAQGQSRWELGSVGDTQLGPSARAPSSAFPCEGRSWP